MNPSEVRLWICSPIHDGTGMGAWANCMLHLGHVLGRSGIAIESRMQFGESVAQARNFLVHDFLKSNGTHLFFIDSDIEFAPADAMRLLQLSISHGTGFDIVAGAYPQKKYPIEYVLNTRGEIQHHQPGRVKDVGCGFMLIRRRVLETLANLHPGWLYKRHDGEWVSRLFQEAVVGNEFLGEDRYFCLAAGDAGFQLWLCPWMNLNHIGRHTYRGDMAKLWEEAAE